VTYETAADLDAALDEFLRPWPCVRAANMEAFARRAAAFCALTDPPRPAAAALRALGIEIVREGLPAGLCAVWSLDGPRYRIRLSPFLSGPRADFTLWHEWFEILAARPVFPSPVTGRPREQAADRFAACLMMPSDAVARAARDFAGRPDKTGVLAARFGVSHAAMRRRLRELGLTGMGNRGRLHF
jgi:hypothetical protein